MAQSFSAYGLYRKTRNAAWHTLIDNNICTLPVDTVTIAKENGVFIIKNLIADILQEDELGASIFDGSYWYIVYDDTLTMSHKNYIIAHELGHIFLGHVHMPESEENKKSGKSWKERDADMYAARLLSPACVLWGLNIHTANEIAGICEIPKDIANTRAKRMKELYSRNQFLKSPLERQVFKQFEDFIRLYKENMAQA